MHVQRSRYGERQRASYDARDIIDGPSPRYENDLSSLVVPQKIQLQQPSAAALRATLPASPSVFLRRGTALAKGILACGVVAGVATATSFLLSATSGFAEAATLGWNLSTAIFAGTVALSALNAWGCYQQLKTIRQSDSAESVPLGMVSINASAFLAFGTFGWQTGHLAMVINGACGLFMAGIAAEIMKRSPKMEPSSKTKLPSSKTEPPSKIKLLGELPRKFLSRPGVGKVLSCASIAGIPAALACTTHKDILLGALLYTAAASLVVQPVQIWWNQSAGAVEPKKWGSYMASSTVWGIYGLLNGNKELMAVNTTIFLASLATVILCFRFRKGEKQQLALDQLQGRTPPIT